MAANIIQTNQIAKIQTNKKLIAFYDKLQPAPLTHYAQLHAKGEQNESDFKVNSLIGISIQDYSNGTGQNNTIVSFNLTPEQIQFLLTRIEVGYQDFEWNLDKIFGNPDQNGYSIAQKFLINRHPMKPDGTVSNNPWFISISNGHGIRVQNKVGGYYMKSGSYAQDKAAFINLNDMDLYMLLKRTDSFIRNWEMVTANRIILQGQASYANYLASLRQASQNPSQPSVQREIGNNYGDNGYQSTSAQSYQRGNAYPADRGNGNYRDNGYPTSSAQSYQRDSTYSDNGSGYYGR